MTQKNNKGKILEGALIGAVIGVAAGILLAPDSGKKTLNSIKKNVGDFYKSVAPQLRKLKNVTEGQLDAFLEDAADRYSKAKKLTAPQRKALMDEVKKSVKHIKKSLK